MRTEKKKEGRKEMTNLLEHYHITLAKEALYSKHRRVLCSTESVVEDAGESEGTAFKPW